MTVTTLKAALQKIRRLEAKVAELEAETEVQQLMIHDFTAPEIIAAVRHKYPALAKRWSVA